MTTICTDIRFDGHSYYLGLGVCRSRKEYRTFKGALKAGRARGLTGDVVDPAIEYRANEGKTKIVTNLQSGRLVRIPVNTPLCCDPSSETYWSM